MTNYSKTEDVADGITFGLQVFEIDDLWCHVARRAAPHKQILWLICPSREAKVSNNAVVVIFLSEQDIFRFKVAVHDPFGMHVLQPHEQPLQNAVNLVVGELLLRFDLIVKLTALQQFH